MFLLTAKKQKEFRKYKEIIEYGTPAAQICICLCMYLHTCRVSARVCKIHDIFNALTFFPLMALPVYRFSRDVDVEFKADMMQGAQI